MGIPVAIELAIWLNQVRNGSISITDAVNAAETLTQDSGLVNESSESEISNWFDLVSLAKKSQSPILGIAPSPGNTYGLPAQLFAKLDVDFGACVINRQLILGYSNVPSQKWTLYRIEHEIPDLDAKLARISIAQIIEQSSATLSALALTGNRDPIDQALAKLPSLHLPPAHSSRVRNDLDLATRILVICQLSSDQAQAVHSRSSDLRKSEELNRLKNAALDLLAISSFAN